MFRQVNRSQAVLSGNYQIILASPEMLQSRSFVSKLLQNPEFSRRVFSMVIDEAHCISHWGASFRKKYATVGVVRSFLPRGTPVLALSATLTPRVRRDIQNKLHFSSSGSLYFNYGNDRPNVSLVVRACEHPLNTFADLDFIIPDSIQAAANVPKTYVYVDDINVGTDILDHLTLLLHQRLGSRDLDAAAEVIRPFNATLSHAYRDEAMSKFRDGSIRILICTDAAGMVCR